MIDKTCEIEDALGFIRDGQTIMFGGFGVPGTPFTLIEAVLKAKIRDLTIIKNEANEDGMGVSKLIEAGLVKKIITTHLGLNRTVIQMMNRGEVEVEFCPQGVLLERMRAGGAGLLGVLSDIGVETVYRDKKEVIQFNGRPAIIEPALRADVALIHAAVADRFGNLIYEKTARNYTPIMALAADCVIAEVEKIVDVGRMDPDQIHTPGVFVDHLIVLRELAPEYGVFAKHVL